MCSLGRCLKQERLKAEVIIATLPGAFPVQLPTTYLSILHVGAGVGPGKEFLFPSPRPQDVTRSVCPGLSVTRSAGAGNPGMIG